MRCQADLTVIVECADSGESGMNECRMFLIIRFSDRC